LAICLQPIYLCITNMITNKYESPPNYQPLKQQRLRQIQEDYFPPPKKNNSLFSSSPPQYLSTTLYVPDYDDQFDLQSNFVVCISQRLYTAIIFILIAAFFFFPVPKTDGSFNWMALAFMIGCFIGVVYCTFKLFDRSIYLSMDEKGLHFHNHDLFIPWGHVIATHFYIDDSDDNDIYQLVTDYVDAASGTCKTEVFNLKEYDKSPGEIALAIQYYQQNHKQNEPNYAIE
jgi:hypothetical protein